MSRISIDVSDQEHQKLKALAALQGITIKEFVLERTLGSSAPEEEEALDQLVGILDARIKRAKQKGIGSRSVDEIFREVRAKKGVAPRHG